MKWFGENLAGAPVCEVAEQIAAPVGAACSRCDKLIGEEDSGLVLPHCRIDRVTEEPIHFGCFLVAIGFPQFLRSVGFPCPRPVDDPVDVVTLSAPVVHIVHILHHGFAMCGKPGVPGSWPKGEVWVRIHDDADRATCGGCREALRRFDEFFAPGRPR